MHPLNQNHSSLYRIATTVMPPAVVVPVAILVGVTVLYRFHRFWRWIRIGLLWSNPDNFVQLSAGITGSFLFGDRTSLRAAALMVWIPSRIVACVDEYAKLGRAYQKWVEAIRGDYPRSPRIHWVKSSSNRAITPSCEIYWRERALAIRVRIGRVARRTSKLVMRAFMLSMRCVDAVEALSLKKSACDQALNEFFRDGCEAISRIASKREEVQEKLEENRLLVNKLLRHMGTTYSVDQLVNSVSMAMDGIEVVDKNVKAIASIGGGVAVDLVKQTLFGAFSLLGIPNKIPEKWLPGDWESEHFEPQPDEQYMPREFRFQRSFAKNASLSTHSVRPIYIAMRDPPAVPPQPLSLKTARKPQYKLVLVKSPAA